MESRLRKLLSPRRHRARRSDATAELDLHSAPYSTAPSQGRLPVFLNQALGKSGAVKQRKSSLPPDSVRTFSYEEAEPGQPPQLGYRPQRGNGPVKLQTSRRLSSGELLVTEQDYDRTLEEIREGEYIVGGKERRSSKTSSQPKSPTETSNPKFVSTAPSSPRDQLSFPGPIWQPPSAFSDVGPVASPVSASSTFSPIQRSYSAQAHIQDYPEQTANHDGLGISSPRLHFYPRHMASTTSLLEPHEEQNPTIQALWKAEYSRLVSIYGQTGVDQTIVQLNTTEANAPLPHELTVNRHRSYSGSLSQPPSHSNYLLPSSLRFGTGFRSNPSASNLDVTSQQDHSDGSSHPRYSHLSSSGASSSVTTRTSITEESSTTRDDIRKIVDDMRSNYLQAIEAQTPPLQPLPSPSLQQPRSKKQTPSLMSYASVDSSLRSASRQSTTRTKSWQSNTTHHTTPRTSLSSPMISSKRPGSTATRRSGQHVAGVATLTPIEASPAKSARSNRTKKNLNIDVGLKRADSTTLGVMARKLTIVDDRASTGAMQPPSTSSPTFYNSSGSDSESGREKTSGQSSPQSSPGKSSSIQHTPQKHKPEVREHSPLSKQPWQVEMDQILSDEELDLAVDIDDFEILCDGLFNSVSSPEDEQLDPFQRWSNSNSSSTRNTFDHDIFSSNTPAELRTSKFAHNQLGLGLTGLPAMI